MGQIFSSWMHLNEDSYHQSCFTIRQIHTDLGIHLRSVQFIFYKIVMPTVSAQRHAEVDAWEENNIIQWNLVITRSFGPWKLPCYIRFLISGFKKTKKYKELGLAIRGFCYIRPLYNEVPLYRAYWSMFQWRIQGGGGGATGARLFDRLCVCFF